MNTILDAWGNSLKRGDIIMYSSIRNLRLGVIRMVDINRGRSDKLLVSFTSSTKRKPKRLGMYMRPTDVMKVDKDIVLKSYYVQEAKELLIELHEVMSVTPCTINP